MQRGRHTVRWTRPHRPVRRAEIGQRLAGFAFRTVDRFGQFEERRIGEQRVEPQVPRTEARIAACNCIAARESAPSAKKRSSRDGVTSRPSSVCQRPASCCSVGVRGASPLRAVSRAAAIVARSAAQSSCRSAYSAAHRTARTGAAARRPAVARPACAFQRRIIGRRAAARSAASARCRFRRPRPHRPRPDANAGTGDFSEPTHAAHLSRGRRGARDSRMRRRRAAVRGRRCGTRAPPEFAVGIRNETFGRQRRAAVITARGADAAQQQLTHAIGLAAIDTRDARRSRGRSATTHTRRRRPARASRPARPATASARSRPRSARSR